MKRFLSISLIVILLSVSCKKENRWDCFKGAGKVTSEERYLNDFTQLEVHDIFNIYITQDTIHKITLKGGENLIPSVTTDVTDGRLVIRNNNKCNWVRDYNKKINLYISVLALKNIGMYGESAIASSNALCIDTIEIDVWAAVSFFDLELNCEAVFFKVHAGTGDFYLKGTTNFSYIWSHGMGHFIADSLYSSETMIYNMSTGDCHINVSDNLSVFITQSGNIYYTGDPQIIIYEMSSDGRLIKNN